MNRLSKGNNFKTHPVISSRSPHALESPTPTPTPNQPLLAVLQLSGRPVAKCDLWSGRATQILPILYWSDWQPKDFFCPSVPNNAAMLDMGLSKYAYFFKTLSCRTTQNLCGPPNVPTGWSATQGFSLAAALPYPTVTTHIQSTHPHSNVNSWTFQKWASAYKLSTRNTRRKMAMMMLQAWICLRARLTESFPPQRPQQRQQQKHRPTNSTSGKETRNTAQDTRMDSSPINSWNGRPYFWLIVKQTQNCWKNGRHKPWLFFRRTGQAQTVLWNEIRLSDLSASFYNFMNALPVCQPI